MGVSSALGSSALLPAGLGFRNAIINGGFDIWQRGESFTNAATGSFTTDRWRYLYDGSGATRIISRGQFQPAVSGATITAALPSDVSLTNFLRWEQTVAGTGATANFFQQTIENVRLLAGKTVTLSFYAKSSASLVLPQIDCAQNFGSGGGGSSSVITVVKTNESVTTSWQKFSYTFLLPSASGKTIAANNDSYTALRFFLPINTVFTFDITGVQLEANVQPTPFEQRPIGTELALCQRYYWRLSAENTGTTQRIGAPGKTYGLNTFVGTIRLPVKMRARPTSLESNGLFATDDQYFDSTSGTWTVAATYCTTESLLIYGSTLSGVTVNGYAQIGMANNTGYFGVSAEL